MLRSYTDAEASQSRNSSVVTTPGDGTKQSFLIAGEGQHHDPKRIVAHMVPYVCVASVSPSSCNEM